MKLLTPAKSSFFFVLFFITIFSVFSQEQDAEAKESSTTAEVALPSDDEPAISDDAKQTFADFLFEIFNFSQTGKTVSEEVPQYEDISGTACSLLMHSLWKDFKPQFVYQFLNPGFAFHEGEDIEPLLVDEPSEIDSLSLLEMLDGRDEPALQEEDETPVLNRIKDGYLRKFSCNGEKFSVNLSGGFTSLTNVSEKLVVRRIYDESFKLIKKETYKNSKELASITQITQTDYEYSPENGNLLKTVLENFPQKTRLERDFSENGRLSAEQKFHYEEIKQPENKKNSSSKNQNDATDSEEKKYELLKDYAKTFEYDDSGRTTEVSLIQYFYSTDAKNRRITSEKKQVTRYEYNVEGRADEYFEEDGILRIKTIYTAAADYTKTFYFDNGFSVVSEFENGLKVSESTWENENLLRRRTFEAD